MGTYTLLRFNSAVLPGVFFGISDGKVVKECNYNTILSWVDYLSLDLPVFHNEMTYAIQSETQIVFSLLQSYPEDFLDTCYFSSPLRRTKRVLDTFTDLMHWEGTEVINPLVCFHCGAPFPTYQLCGLEEICHKCQTAQKIAI